MKMEQIECFETSAFNNQMPGKYPKDYIQDSKHSESLKSRLQVVFVTLPIFVILYNTRRMAHLKVLYRLFGTSSSSIFKRQAVGASLNHENWTDKLSRKVVEQLPSYAA
jgi:hypothetical protein